MRTGWLIPALVPITVAALAAPPALAAPTQPVNRARAAAEQAHLAFQQRMVARRQAHPVAAAPSLVTPTAVPFGTITNTQQASRDTLPAINGAEPDTQAEPDIAISPSNPNVIVATFQQGRYRDGGSVDVGYTTSQDGGKTWAAGSLPQLTIAVGGPFDRASGAVAAMGADGAGYLEPVAFNAHVPPNTVDEI